MPEPHTSIENKLKALQQAFAQKLPDRLHEIDQSFSQLTELPTDHEKLEILTRQIHTLAGSGSTFGFPRITELARQGEELLKAHEIIHHGLNNDVQQAIQKILSTLSTINTNNDNGYISKAPQHKPVATNSVNRKRKICILESNNALSKDLQQQFLQYSYDPVLMTSIDDCWQYLDSNVPDVVIIDLLYANSINDRLNALLRKSVDNEIITIATCRDGDIHHRLLAAKVGAHVFFIKPFDISHLIDRIDNLSKKENDEPYRVLIVDDSYELAKFYCLTLENAGFSASFITQPFTIMDAIQHEQPELILLDLYMPECSGLELATVIRQQEDYIGTPIVFLSSESDISKQLAAMRSGGDDFLTKPIQAEHLITSVSIRINRYRRIKSLFIKDSLTGLHNHTSIKKQLHTEILRAQRNNSQLSLAMIDIDYFKQVNDQYGHNAGDRVIKSLARLMHQRLRQTDILGRYGGDEFVVILPETNSYDAEWVLEKLRVAFENLKIHDKHNIIQVSITCGIASYPPSSNADELSESADKALYDAKEQGRNCIRLFKK